MPQYALANHVFVCLQGEHVVFLDVRKDRYFALEAAKTSGIGAVIPGWPVRAAVEAELLPPTEEVAQSPVMALLLQKELLSGDSKRGKDATPVTVEPLIGELTSETYDGASSLDTASSCRFIVAALTASAALRWRKLESVVQRVRRRNEAHRPRAPSFDEAGAHQLVARFAALRPFFFTAKDACLFEALALSEFLAGHGLFPRWVFGVQARPFAAHCWLQQNGIVLNDTVEHVSRYTPIMSV
jgi:hypothetical protein